MAKDTFQLHGGSRAESPAAGSPEHRDGCWCPSLVAADTFSKVTSVSMQLQSPCQPLVSQPLFSFFINFNSLISSPPKKEWVRSEFYAF